MKEEDFLMINTLYNLQNLTRTAEALYLSQPTLTKHLRSIEEELGITVVKRSNRGVVFTPEGEYLARQSEHIYNDIRDLRKYLSGMRQELSGTIRVATSSSFARMGLLQLIDSYTKINNKVSFMINVMLSSEALQAVQNEKADIAFVNGDREHDNKQILCSTGNLNIISRDPVSLDELPSRTMITHNRDRYSRSLIEHWWKHTFNCSMPVGTRVQDIDTSLRWVRYGRGYGVIFDNCLGKEDKYFMLPCLDEDGNPIRRNTWAICRKENADMPIIQDVMNYIERQAGTPEGNGLRP